MSYTQTNPLHPNLRELLIQLPLHDVRGWRFGDRFFRVDFCSKVPLHEIESLQLSYGYGHVWDERGLRTETPIVNMNTLYIYVGLLAK